MRNNTKLQIDISRDELKTITYRIWWQYDGLIVTNC